MATNEPYKDNDDDLGPLPRVHPREDIVRAARMDLEGFLIDWTNRHQLTSAEWHDIVLQLQLARMHQLVRAERKSHRDDQEP